MSHKYTINFIPVELIAKLHVGVQSYGPYQGRKGSGNLPVPKASSEVKGVSGQLFE